MAGSLGCLKAYCISLGTLLLLASVAGIGFCLFLLFGDPFAVQTQGTYSPNWENIGPAFVASIISLLANLCLIGGAKQLSKEILLFWIVWKNMLIILFWLWFGYSQMKYKGYIDWREYGMRRCYWCDLPEAKYIGLGGAASSLVLILLMIPVCSLHLKLKRQLRELTEFDFAPVVYNPAHYKY